MNESRCPDARMLQALLAGETSAEVEARWEKHLSGCAACQSRLEQLAGAETVGDAARLAAALPGADSSRLNAALHTARRAMTGKRPAPANVGNAAHSAGPDSDQQLILRRLAPAQLPGSVGRLLDYDITSVLGRGAMGVVLLGRDPRLDRQVAVKVPSPTLIGDERFRLRFLREARAAAGIGHPNVVTIHAIHEVDRLPVLVMEYVAGESLAQHIRRVGPLPAAEIARIGEQVAAGLHAAHQRGIVHRDVKPSNVLLDAASGRAKISDFGLALVDEPSELTRDGVIVGTPEFMSPEQVQSRAVDFRADLFSLGSVLYAMCTGRPPFQSNSTISLLLQVATEDPEPIATQRSDLPAELLRIIARLHRREPAERFASADEAAKALSRCLNNPPEPPPVAKTAVSGQWSVASSPSRPQTLPPAPPKVRTDEGIRPTPSAPPKVRTDEGVHPTPSFKPDSRRPGAGRGTKRPGAGGGKQRPARGNPWLWTVGVTGLLLAAVVAVLAFSGNGSRRPQPPKERAATGTRPINSPDTNNGLASADTNSPVANAQSTIAIVYLGKSTPAASLAEAVKNAPAGATIVIDDSGEHVIDSLFIDKRLHIRAGQGRRPLLVCDNAEMTRERPVFDVRAPLVLEGLEIRAEPRGGDGAFSPQPEPQFSPQFGPQMRFGLFIEDVEFGMACCRLSLPRATVLATDGTRRCEIRQSELRGDVLIEWGNATDGKLRLEDSLAIGGTCLLSPGRPQPPQGTLEFDHATVCCEQLARFMFEPDRWSAGETPLLIAATKSAFFLGETALLLDSPPPLANVEASAADFTRWFRWRGESNTFVGGNSLLAGGELRIDELADWRQFWSDDEPGSRRVHAEISLRSVQLGPPVAMPNAPPAASFGRIRRLMLDHQVEATRGCDFGSLNTTAAYDAWLTSPSRESWLQSLGFTP